MVNLARSAALVAAPVMLSLAFAAGPASAAPVDTPSSVTSAATAAAWTFWDSYASSRTCNNIGAMGVLGGAWSAYTCSYIPVDDQPYWLFVDL